MQMLREKATDGKAKLKVVRKEKKGKRNGAAIRDMVR